MIGLFRGYYAVVDRDMPKLMRVVWSFMLAWRCHWENRK